MRPTKGVSMQKQSENNMNKAEMKLAAGGQPQHQQGEKSPKRHETPEREEESFDEDDDRVEKVPSHEKDIPNKNKEQKNKPSKT
jgi:hypothetical protein